MKHVDTDTAQPHTVAKIANDFSESRAIGTTATGNRYVAVDLDTITDAESFAIRALRDWTRATTDTAFRRDMDAWEEMRIMTGLYAEGKHTLDDARQNMGNLSALSYYLMVRQAATIHEWFACKLYKENDGGIDKTAVSYADFESWQLLHSETSQLLEGGEPSDLDVAHDPELYALCNSIKAWIEKNRAKFIAERGGSAE